MNRTRLCAAEKTRPWHNSRGKQGQGNSGNKTSPDVLTHAQAAHILTNMRCVCVYLLISIYICIYTYIYIYIQIYVCVCMCVCMYACTCCTCLFTHILYRQTCVSNIFMKHADTHSKLMNTHIVWHTGVTKTRKPKSNNRKSSQ